jgi:hypothetical protein
MAPKVPGAKGQIGSASVIEALVDDIERLARGVKDMKRAAAG